jgi:hypothetical protein
MHSDDILGFGSVLWRTMAKCCDATSKQFILEVSTEVFATNNPLQKLGNSKQNSGNLQYPKTLTTYTSNPSCQAVTNLYRHMLLKGQQSVAQASAATFEHAQDDRILCVLGVLQNSGC